MPRLATVLATPAPLFVYGTLMFPPIIRTLIGRVPESEPAEITDWRTAAVTGATYPVLVPAAGRTAGGLLMHGLTDVEWGVLDAYEDALYEMSTVVTVAGHTAWTYAAPPDGDDTLSEHDWDPAAFESDHLVTFNAAVARWRADIDVS